MSARDCNADHSDKLPRRIRPRDRMVNRFIPAALELMFYTPSTTSIMF
jgi:hypothetical protein